MVNNNVTWHKLFDDGYTPITKMSFFNDTPWIPDVDELNTPYGIFGSELTEAGIITVHIFQFEDGQTHTRYRLQEPYCNWKGLRVKRSEHTYIRHDSSGIEMPMKVDQFVVEFKDSKTEMGFRSLL